MHTEVMVLDCPAYTDRHGTTRCGLPATVESRYTIYSTDGPQHSAKISCPRGHRFNGPIEALTRQVTGPQADGRRPAAGAAPGGPRAAAAQPVLPKEPGDALSGRNVALLPVAGVLAPARRRPPASP